MAFSFTSLKYGWAVLAGITLGTTIYIVNNTRHQVKQEDVAELILGECERCIATQSSTNNYSVDPPTNFVRYWVDSDGAGGYVTNAVTNSIGWQVDQSILVSLDPKIKETVVWYEDTNTLYEGSTGVYALTITGLWASLGIGDRTSQFTSVPCWTNPVQTNWHVCYTSYWPTNGATFPTTNNYTSAYNQVVNYGASWTATGGVVWASLTNWPNDVVITTNAATYGDYPWQIYTEDLGERYKVIWSLQKSWHSAKYPKYITWQGVGHGSNSWDEARADAEANYAAFDTNFTPMVDVPKAYCKGAHWSNYVAQGGGSATNFPGKSTPLEWYDWTEHHHDFVRTDLIAVLTNNDGKIWTTNGTNRFIVGTDPRVINCVKDRNTGYVWAKAIEGPTYNWSNAFIACEGHNGAAGYYFTNWHLPSVAELQSINGTLEYQTPGIFNIVWAMAYPWSSDEYDEDEAWRCLPPGTAVEFKSANGNVWAMCDGVGWPGGGDPDTNAVPGPDCSGQYEFADPLWVRNDAEWFFVYDDEEETWYITQNLSTYIPSWSKIGSTNVVGWYPVINNEYGQVGIYGQVTSYYYDVYNDWDEDHHDAVMRTNSFGTNHLFYQCWLIKRTVDYDSWLTTNIEHKVSYWAWSSEGTYADYNLYDDQGLGLTEDVYNMIEEGDWTSNTNWPFTFGGDLATPPVDFADFDATEAGGTNFNKSACIGYMLGPPFASAEWKFQYCTNRYW